jgi:hypothetical protein
MAFGLHVNQRTRTGIRNALRRQLTKRVRLDGEGERFTLRGPRAALGETASSAHPAERSSSREYWPFSHRCVPVPQPEARRVRLWRFVWLRRRVSDPEASGWQRTQIGGGFSVSGTRSSGTRLLVHGHSQPLQSPLSNHQSCHAEKMPRRIAGARPPWSVCPSCQISKMIGSSPSPGCDGAA